MAGSVNKVILIGNLGADPEIRHTQDGRPIVNLRVATSESWRDKASGERKEKHRVAPRRHLQRGPVPDRRAIFEEGLEDLLEGQLQTRKWQDQSGQDRYSTEVVLQGFNSQLTMLDGKPGRRRRGARERRRFKRRLRPLGRAWRRRRPLLRQGARRRNPVLGTKFWNQRSPATLSGHRASDALEPRGSSRSWCRRGRSWPSPPPPPARRASGSRAPTQASPCRCSARP